MHRIAWKAGAPARLALLGLIRLYRVTLSGWLGGQCRFYPTCSHYAEDAIRARRRTYADSRVRPFARRRARIDRPARVRIRTRKPCLR